MTNPNLIVHSTRCACGGKLIYKPSTCGWKCYHGSLYQARENGLVALRACPKAKS